MIRLKIVSIARDPNGVYIGVDVAGVLWYYSPRSEQWMLLTV